MGYTHYWYRKKEIPKDKFYHIVADLNKLMPIFKEAGILIAGGLGEGRPRINGDEIWFNGKLNCGHEKNTSL